MGRRTTRAPGRPKQESGAPSWRFVVFAILGLIVLIWFVIAAISNPPSAPLQ